MLSILIPCYNHNCFKLVSDLQKQCVKYGCRFEIIVCDDYSSDSESITANSKIEELEGCHFMKLEKNIGRASIRNLLAENAQYQRLLFLDCDAEVCNESFIQNYLETDKKTAVICGGLKHADKLPAPGLELRYKYEKKADKHRGAKERMISPYSHFSTFSFLIDKDDFLKIKFDEQFAQYGYEDVLFGIRLKEMNIPIIHIDNPLIHTGLESNDIFLSKTEIAIKTLLLMREKFGNETTLLKGYKNAKKFSLTGLLNFIWNSFNQKMRKNLLSNNPSLFIFKIYKATLFAHLSRE